MVLLLCQRNYPLRPYVEFMAYTIVHSDTWHKAPDIHVNMQLTGRCGQVLYFCSISRYPCARETIYANNDTAKYTAKIDSYISGLLFKYVTWS